MKSSEVEQELAEYLRNLAKSRRKNIEIELHRIEQHALDRLKAHGLKVKKKPRSVVLMDGPRLGFGIPRSNDVTPYQKVELATFEVLKDRTRPCKYTYDAGELRRMALDVLTKKRVAKDDLFAATIALRLPGLWVAYSLANAQSLELAVDLVGIASELPSPGAMSRMSSQAQREAAKGRKGEKAPHTRAIERICNSIGKEASMKYVLELIEIEKNIETFNDSLADLTDPIYLWFDDDSVDRKSGTLTFLSSGNKKKKITFKTLANIIGNWHKNSHK